MATMTLAKLLKYKKRVVERLGKIDQQIRDNNSILSANTREKDPRQLMSDRADVVGHLLAVKNAQSLANIGIIDKILMLGETKGQITLLQSLETKHGKHTTSTYSETYAEYDAVFKADDVDIQVRQLQKLIDETQEEIDAYNYATNITLPEAPAALGL